MAITNLITNPSFELDLVGWRPAGAGTLTRVSAADTRTEIITNMVANPSGETGTTGWMRAAGVAEAVLTASTEQARTGAQSFRLEASAAGRIGMEASPHLTGFTAGQTYTVSAYPRAATTGRQAYVATSWYDAAGAFISSSSSSQVTDGLNWNTRIAHTATAPTGAAQMRPVFFILDAALGEVHYLDGVMVTQTTSSVAYFDGATPNTATDVHAWTGAAHASTSTRTETLAGWSWRGAWAARGTRAAMAPTSAAAVLKLPGAGVGAAGKTIGFRLTANVLTNPGGLRLMAQTVNAAGTLGTPYINMTPAPRDPGVFNGVGEWEWRGLYTLPTTPEPDIYLFLSAVNGGDGDVIIDAALASFDLIDRSVTRPGEGLDVPPYGDGDDSEWEWEGLAHQSRSVRKSNKVNWVRNPSGEVDASFATTNDPSSTTTPANRIVPTRITSDLEAPEGAAVLEWQIIANADGYASVMCGDSQDLVATATPVSNQEITVFSGWLRIMTALPSGATVGPSLRSYSSTGESQVVKGYLAAPPVGWASMLSAALEEFPAAAQATTVPNVPPRWALGGFLFSGLTPGGTYVVRTDMGMFRRDHLGTAAGSLGYYNYFDGGFPNAVWLGVAGVSASALAVVTDVPGPPSTPTGLTATYTPSPVGVTLAWQASPEADVAGYVVYRDGVGLADVAATSYVDSTVKSGTTYSYTVAAYDVAGNQSPQSTIVLATTGIGGGNLLYPKYKENLISGLLTQTVRIILVDTASYVYSESHQFLSDVPIAARVATSEPLANKSVTRGVFDASDVTFSLVTGNTFEYLLLYIDTNVETTSRLIARLDTATGLPFTPAPEGSTVVLTFADSAYRVFAI